MNNLKEMPIAEFLLTINTVMPTMDFEKRLESAKITRQEDNAFMEITKPIGYKVEDNSMFPILQQGSIVNLEIKEEYSNGDILCFAKKKGKGVFFRKGFFANEKRTKLNLIAVNDNISVTVDIKDIEIIGRVKTIITEIE
ncbi:MAG: S24 family peptidase [Oscillospiraceae bacterium]